MKVLIISWRDITHPEAGGAELYLHELARRFASSGHEITLLTSRYKGCAEQEVIDGVSIIRRGSKYVFNLAVLWTYLRELRSNGYQIVVEDVYLFPLFTPIFVHQPKTVVITNHLYKGNFLRQVPLPFIPAVWLGEKALRLYQKLPVTTLSVSSKKDLIDMGIPEENITIINPGLDCELYRPSTSMKTRYPSVVYLGMVKKKKNIDHLIKAMVEVKKVLPEARLIIAGRGLSSLYRKLKALADRLNLDSSVNFYGEVTAEEKVRLFQSAWVSVHPSAKEGWGIPVIEANACGTPAIAYDVPGHSDSIRSGETGLLVAYGDIGALACGMVKLLTDTELRERLSQNAVVWASNFSWDKSAQDFMAVLQGTGETGDELKE